MTFQHFDWIKITNLQVLVFDEEQKFAGVRNRIAQNLACLDLLLNFQDFDWIEPNIMLILALTLTKFINEVFLAQLC